MSTIFESFRKALDNTGFPSNPFLFLLFLVTWVMGASIGTIIMVLGVDPREFIRNKDVEMEEMIARMNEQGPNN